MGRTIFLFFMDIFDVFNYKYIYLCGHYLLWNINP